MEIETKFSIGDQLWTIQENKVCEGRVVKIFIDIDLSNCIRERYTVLITTSHINIPVLDIDGFKTKEELLKSL